MEPELFDISSQFHQHFMSVDEGGRQASRKFSTWESVLDEVCTFSTETYTNWSVRDSEIVDGVAN